jgi:ubiquinone/menaquinone biosynthesis C-methylase UbiE
MVYDTLKYWNKRKSPNSKGIELDTPIHLSFLKKHLSGAVSVLDFGPGNGRLLEAYVGINEVEGYDISSIYKDRILEKATSLKVNFSLTIGKNVEKLHYKTDEFDAAVATEVLLHQKPEYINLIMLELARVSSKVVAISWMECGIPFNIERGHCFHYNYFKLCEQNNLEIIDFQKYKKQIMFVYRKK